MASVLKTLAEQRQSSPYAHWMAASKSSNSSTHQALLQEEDRASLVFTFKFPRHAHQTFAG